MFVDIIKVFVL